MAGKRSRSLNATGNGPIHGAESTNAQDVKRRMGTFGGAGEHPRVGGRTTGIVGQKKQRFATSKRSK
jgi:hypothetical protein